MSVLAITCDNCGAKYRLPESFSGDKAKCQKCGSVIDVAAQRTAAAAPTPPAKPAAVKPAAEAPKKAATKAAANDEAPAPRASRASKNAEAKSDAKSARGRKEADEKGPKKSNTMLLAGGGIAALAIVAVIVVLASGGKEKPKTTETAQAPAASKPESAPKAAEANAAAAPAAVEATAKKEQPVAAEAVPQDKKPTDQKPAQAKAADQKPAQDNPAEAKAETKPVAQTPTAPAAAEPKSDASKPAESEAKGGSEIKERWEANKTTSLADVYKPAVLGDVSWPADCEAAQKDEIVSLIEDVCGGGKPGIAAKPKLEKIGYYAIFGLVDRLRKLDYASGDDQMTAWELNKLIETIASGMNAGFVAVEAGGDLDPRKADHNARTNVAWDRLLSKFENKTDFDKWRKERQNKSK